MKKLSDLIAKRIKKEVDMVFGVTGGCIVNLVDSFYKAGLKIIPMHHEQSAAIAADAYARFKGFGVCYGTSGPGNTNLITGTCCSFYDSIPVLTIGGQVPRKYLNNGRDRQVGFQEVDGVRLFRPITKYSKRMKRFEDLEDAINIAKEGRPGPTFLEICDDYQRDAEWCNGKARETHNLQDGRFESSLRNIDHIVDYIVDADKPLVIVGSGARNMPLELRVPFLYTWGVKDKFYNHPYCKGDFGITGSPNGNRMIKESDLILMIGTRMDTHQVPNWKEFAPKAHKIAMGLEFPHKVNELYETNLTNLTLRLKGRNWGKREENKTDTPVYRWIDKICEESNEDDIIIPDMGQTGCIAWQRWKPKGNQRMFNAFGHSPMGYSLPAAIGASLATGRRVISIIGDGSLMMNFHDLVTISDLKLPIVTYVVNNGGYGMIRQTQSNWPEYLEQNVACNFKIPNIKKLRKLFKIDIQGIKFKDTTISPKWKWGEKL